jgi:hypothetical protein
MLSVEDFIYGLEAKEKNIVEKLDYILTINLGLISKIRYKIPFYYNQSWVCYINPLKKGGIELAFIRGNEMPNTHGVLETKERKQIMGITFHATSEIQEALILELVSDALHLDEQVPYIKKKK